MTIEASNTYTTLPDPRHPVGPTQWGESLDSQGLSTDGYGEVGANPDEMPGDASDAVPLRPASTLNDGRL